MAVAFLSSCNYDNVEVIEIRRVKIDRLDRAGLDFTASLWVVNPNGYRIKVTSTDADVYLDGRKAGNAILAHNVVIPANFEGEIQAEVKTAFEESGLKLIPIIIGAAVNRRVGIRVVGKARGKSFMVGHSFDFDYSDEARF